MKTQKKLARLLCAFSLLQSYAHAAMSYGFHVGTNFASARVEGSSTDTGTATKIGVAAGVGVDVFLGGPLYLQMELSYMQRGFQVSSGQNVLGSTDRAVIDYLEFPILLRVKACATVRIAFLFWRAPSTRTAYRPTFLAPNPTCFTFFWALALNATSTKLRRFSSRAATLLHSPTLSLEAPIR